MHVPADLILMIAKKSVDMLADFAKSHKFGGRIQIERSEASRRLQNHIKETLKWSEQVYFPGLPSGRTTSNETIALRFAVGERRYRSIGSDAEVINESDIFSLKSNVLLLGAPGSGKTTTIKRFYQVLFENSGAPEITPILIRVRNLRQGKGIVSILFDLFGVVILPPNAPKESYTGSGFNHVKCVESEELAYEDAKDILFSILDSRKILILIDGLDECDPKELSELVNEISEIARKASNCPMLATSRTGVTGFILERFSTYEILSLTEREICKIAKFYLKRDLRLFKSELKRTNLSELADRPLLVVQMVLLFNINRRLPEKLSDLYHEIIHLLLRKWDESYDFVRRSKYAGFDPRRKYRFLQALAFELLFRQAKRTFTRRDLIAVYSNIHRRFALPQNQAEAVARELEAHTGIVAESAAGVFEFFHLSIQEYLAAGFVVEVYRGDVLRDMFNQSPSTLAICVAISHDSTEWLKALLVILGTGRGPSQNKLGEFLYRLAAERPEFVDKRQACLAFLRLLNQLHVDALRELRGSVILTINNLGLLSDMRLILKSMDEVVVDYYNYSMGQPFIQMLQEFFSADVGGLKELKKGNRLIATKESAGD